MTQQATRDEIVEKDGIVVGPYRRPQNLGQGQAGSIHDDSTAKNLGFRGGTIAGSIHLEQFPPLLTSALGDRWWQQGSFSAYFRNATVHDEAVRGFVERPPAGSADAQVNVWMEDENGMRVLEGTAAVGEPDQQTALRKRIADVPPRGEVRILEHLQPGMEMPSVETRRSLEDSERRMKIITEPLDWYTGGSPWGGAIMTPNMLVGALRAPEAGLDMRRNRAVGLFGGIELRHINGPAFVDRDYTAAGEVLAVGETPRSEYFWYEAVLSEADGGREVAAMIMMLRFMKGSSPLWAES